MKLGNYNKLKRIIENLDDMVTLSADLTSREITFINNISFDLGIFLEEYDQWEVHIPYEGISENIVTPEIAVYIAKEYLCNINDKEITDGYEIEKVEYSEDKLYILVLVSFYKEKESKYGVIQLKIRIADGEVFDTPQ